jgi:hypothetical protein
MILWKVLKISSDIPKENISLSNVEYGVKSFNLEEMPQVKKR